MATQMQLKVLFLKEITWSPGRLERKNNNKLSIILNNNKRNIILKGNVSSFNKNGNVFCCWLVIESPPANDRNCKLYNNLRLTVQRDQQET